MAKKKPKVSPVIQYINMQRDWADLCHQLVYGKKVDGKCVFNIDLDSEVDYHPLGTSDALKIKGDYSGSGIFKGYKLLSMGYKALEEVSILSKCLCTPVALDTASKVAMASGYKDLDDLFRKSMSWDETAQLIRNQLIKEISLWVL